MPFYALAALQGEVVIGQPEEPGGDDGAQGQEDRAVAGQVGRRRHQEDHPEDEQASHGGSAGLHGVGGRPIGADGLAQTAPCQKGHHRASRCQRDHKGRTPYHERIDHLSRPSHSSNRGSTVSRAIARDAFSSTTSPGSRCWRRSWAASSFELQKLTAPWPALAGCVSREMPQVADDVDERGDFSRTLAHQSVSLLLQGAQFAHVSQHRDATPRQLGQQVQGRHHGGRAGVVGVVQDGGAAAGPVHAEA